MLDPRRSSVLTPEQQQIERLVARFQRDDHPQESFHRLFDLCYRRVYSLFSRRGLAHPVCQDLSQETFLQVYQGLADFRGDARFETWLFQIALNNLRRYLRHGAALKRSADEVGLEEAAAAIVEPSQSQPLQVVLQRERVSALRHAVDSLPRTMRRCLRLLIDKGMSYREIARELALTEQSVKTYQYQARRRLRAALSDPNGLADRGRDKGHDRG